MRTTCQTHHVHPKVFPRLPTSGRPRATGIGGAARRRFVLSVLLLITRATTSTAAPPNVLFIVIDDLRPELGCYGQPHIHSPNIDRLAQSGRMFSRAYCQQALCNPSRTSLLTGLRPDAIGVTGNHVHFRSRHTDLRTLPQCFKDNGYHACSIGKVYHGVFPPGASKTPWDSMADPASWSVPTIRFGPRYYFTKEGVRQARAAYLASYRPKTVHPDDWTRRLVFGPMTEAPQVADSTLYDGKVTNAAIAVLRELSDKPQPFFLAVGFIKPHTPFVAPQKYWDLYDNSSIALASAPTFPHGAPDVARHGSGEVRRYSDQPQEGPFSERNQRRMRHGYFACISFIDAQVGRILKALEQSDLSDNTIVVLCGDHGWHLGEHGLWGKTSNFELDARVPFMMRVPGMPVSGVPTRSLAELVDIYPTLLDLADLSAPHPLAGQSLRPLLENPVAVVKEVAFTQHPRGGNADRGGRWMGYSMRTERWRYTEWSDSRSGQVLARELYDHAHDPSETINLASDPRHAATLNGLSARLARERAAHRNPRDPASSEDN